MRYVRRYSELGLKDLPEVGGKNASLGELVQALAPQGVRIPEGFALTAAAYRTFVADNGLEPIIRENLAKVRPGDPVSLAAAGLQIRQAFLAGAMPAEVGREIREAYGAMGNALAGWADVAVRSSATAEDLPEASFAGQQETYLHVQGPVQVEEACRHCFASLFTDRAISYRHDQGIDPANLALSVGIQRMVRSDRAVAGVMFTLDTETGFQDVVLINAAYGLGESVVQGLVTPDEFLVFKPTLKRGYRPILQKRLGSKETKLIYDEGGNRRVRTVPVTEAERRRFTLDDEAILTLARWACLVEDHYSAQRGSHTAMDLEWAQDGPGGPLYLLQARPETVQSRKAPGHLELYHLEGKGRICCEGRSVGERIAAGRVRVLHNVHELDRLQEGEILVSERTDPDWEPVMRKARAVVTNRGGRTCHAAIVSRELGLPAVVGTGNATDRLVDGQEVTVSCAEGETGFVYEGVLPYHVERVDLLGLPKPGTRLMVNVAKPDGAFALSFLPQDGVGLAREEFIISSSIGIHPMALVEFEHLQDLTLKKAIDARTPGYANKAQFFVDRLAEGISVIAAAFHPKDVILRFSDFKTNEYAGLLGGEPYEPKEENPMLGFRGASRYYDPRYRPGFALECRAALKVREEMGLWNLKLMIPFCRTVDEGRRVLHEMALNGLRRGEHGLEVYVMCEIPSNVILAEAFAELFDGFSIGSNDLTQLVLGVDRDSEVVAHLFDERNAAVMTLIAQVIKAAKAKGRKVGICGQAPSDYPEFARFLVKQGIDSISLNPDSLLRTTLTVLEAEGKGALAHSS
ncbi:MAG TPA: phosphoenolpyruvate synthase [Holophagaceae bacterium]|nr:phosphoenolpyruvate synthase [Holophagaceae bacterium]